MLGVGGVLEDGGGSPVDSVVVDALQRGQWSPGDLLLFIIVTFYSVIINLLPLNYYYFFKFHKKSPMKKVKAKFSSFFFTFSNWHI